MRKTFCFFLVFMIGNLLLSNCDTSNATETLVTATASTVTSTNTLLPTATPSPTATPVPDVNLESFVFPYDVSQVMTVWGNLQVPAKYRYFTYYIINRSSRAIPYSDPCGYHPGI